MLFIFIFQSMPILTEKIEKCDSSDKQPIWGQFHFFPNGSISDMNSKLVKQSNPYVSSTSFTTIGTNVEVGSFYSAQ